MIRFFYSIIVLIVAVLVALGCFIFNAGALTFLKVVGFIVIGWWVIGISGAIAVFVYVARSFFEVSRARSL